ncbi:MAG: radical SAM protein [Oscillospiraceae bacterium]|nr:radical SAM protein [Oscillospiraceae bacterium]
MAKFLTPVDCNQKREKLHEILPLEGGPFCVRFMVTNVCNFRCYYCRQAEPEEQRKKLGLDHTVMSFDDFKKCIDHLEGFDRFKVFNFTGGGEPLTHPDIIHMVEYVKNKDFTKSIEITTNGALLTHEMSDALLTAGVDRIKVSLQGCSDKEYKETCGVAVNYERFKEQLQYFHEHKGPGVVLFAKIIDKMLPTQEARQNFIEEYRDIVDEYEIECLYPTPGAKQAVESAYDNTLYGQKVDRHTVCPQPFYSTTVFPNGYAYPCCPLPNPAPICNLVTDRLADYWHGPEHKAFLLRLLKGERERMPVCRDCTLFDYFTAPNDNLDPYAMELFAKYETL